MMSLPNTRGVVDDHEKQRHDCQTIQVCQHRELRTHSRQVQECRHEGTQRAKSSFICGMTKMMRCNLTNWNIMNQGQTNSAGLSGSGWCLLQSRGLCRTNCSRARRTWASPGASRAAAAQSRMQWWSWLRLDFAISMDHCTSKVYMVIQVVCQYNILADFAVVTSIAQSPCSSSSETGLVMNN